jgi:hypothetical protein
LEDDIGVETEVLEFLLLLFLEPYDQLLVLLTRDDLEVHGNEVYGHMLHPTSLSFHLLHYHQGLLDLLLS